MTAGDTGQPNLYPWQVNALAQWEQAGRQGIIEAVTGTGKTLVGIEAIRRLRSQYRSRIYPLVVVPTIVLMDQWFERLRTAFPGKRVGRIGNGYSEDFSTLPIACVAVINSAVQRVEDLLAHCRKYYINKSLLVADECHHYIDAPVFSRIREFPFDYTLGLSATIFPFEVRGLGRIEYEYRFKDACKDGIVPQFELVNTAVSLTKDEHDEYFRLTSMIGEQWQIVEELCYTELEGTPPHRRWNKLREIVKQGDDEALTIKEIKRLFNLTNKRTEIVYTAAWKCGLAEKLTRMLVDQGRKKLVVFFERILSAEEMGEGIARRAAQGLRVCLGRDSQMWCKVYHSQLQGSDRPKVIEEFRRVGPSALLVCRSLDEGIDIPQVDAAILAASTQSRRQRIQRIGRTLRKGDGNKRPLIITLIAQGTNDENVTAEDEETFGGVANIHEATEQTCLEKVRQLM